MHEFPVETVLVDTSAVSCTARLKDHFRQLWNGATLAPSGFVFVGPVDATVATPHVYVQRCVPHVLGDILAEARDVYVTVDVDADFDYNVAAFSAMLPLGHDGVDLKVYSFADPGRMPVTCVLLHFIVSSPVECC